MSDVGHLGERFVAELTGNVFLREFVLSSARLAVDQGEIELADTLVLLRGLVIACQVKERDPSADSSDGALEQWFKKKVNDQAVAQIAASLGYLREHSGRTVLNDRGHEITLSATAEEVASIVVYSAPEAPSFRSPMGRETSRAGFVHFVEATDYFGICAVLWTPVEIAEYLTFREAQVRASKAAEPIVSEKALLGQFLVEADGPPDEKYASAMEILVDSGRDADLFNVLHNLGDRVDYRSGDESETSHYSILQELALLSRTGVAHFKERLTVCVDAVRSGAFRNPTHFANPDTDCGFVLTPWDPGLRISPEDYLGVLTRLSKYSLGARRQVGVLVSADGDDLYVLWSFMDSPHVPDAELDAALAAEGCPLPPTTIKSEPRYQFDTAALQELLGSEEGAGGAR